MSACIEDFFKRRRSHYRLSREVRVDKEEIERVVRFAAMHTPSAFNSQSSRIVVLFDESHDRFWNLVCEKISHILPHDAFEKSRKKIESSFAAGYGTILFFEDGHTIEVLKKNYPLYSAAFPVYSQHTSAMHQYALWLLLSDLHLGASLQHYGELVEEDVKKIFSLPDTWQLVAQMPFGTPLDTPEKKNFLPLEERVLFFG